MVRFKTATIGGRSGLAAMTRYFFHFRDGDGLHEDPEGVELPDIEAARAEALAAAREIMADKVRAAAALDNESFEIRDDKGRTVATVLLREALKSD